MHAEHSWLSNTILGADFVKEFSLGITFTAFKVLVPLAFRSVSSCVDRHALLHETASNLGYSLTLAVVAYSSIDVSHRTHAPLCSLVWS